MSSADTFDGAEEVRRAWMAGLAPDPSLTVSQGEYRHRVLSSRAASEAGNAMLFEEFPGGILLLMGTNSATGPRSIPARYIFLDEVDAYTGSSVESRAANTVNGISPNSSIA